jgi:hypothetical protein
MSPLPNTSGMAEIWGLKYFIKQYPDCKYKSCLLCTDGLNWLTQHFILIGKMECLKWVIEVGFNLRVNRDERWHSCTKSLWSWPCNQKLIITSMSYGFFVVWIKEIDFSFCSLGRTRRKLRNNLSQPDIHHNSQADDLRWCFKLAKGIVTFQPQTLWI